MYAVVNRLRFKESAPAGLWQQAQADIPARARGVPGFQSLYVVETAPDEVVLVILADARETLDRIADEVGNTWMREHVLPHLAAPPERQVGKVVTNSDT